MGIGYGNTTVYDSVSSVTGPSGWYMFNVFGNKVPLYINQDYDGGGWVLVLANRRYTAGMNNLKFQDAMNSVNYRNAGSDDTTNLRGMGNSSPNLSDINCWVGLNYWKHLSGRAVANKIAVVQFMDDTNGVSLNASHPQRARFLFDNVNTNGSFSGRGSYVNESDVNAWGTSGFYTYCGNPLTTYDNDQDYHSGNCSTFYNNNPFWYGACWSGNIFAGGGYIDGPYWVSSSATYSKQYCGVYIK